MEGLSKESFHFAASSETEYGYKFYLGASLAIAGTQGGGAGGAGGASQAYLTMDTGIMRREHGRTASDHGLVLAIWYFEAC